MSSAAARRGKGGRGAQVWPTPLLRPKAGREEDGNIWEVAQNSKKK